MEQKKKIGMSGLNWALSIIGILFFISIIALPPIFRATIEEEADDIVESPTPTPDESEEGEDKILLKVCTKQTDRVETTIALESRNDRVFSFEQIVTTHYQEGEDFIDGCNAEAGLYQDIPNFEHSCTVEGTNTTTTSRVDLTAGLPENIPISYDLSKGEKALEDELTSLGFTCNDSKN